MISASRKDAGSSEPGPCLLGSRLTSLGIQSSASLLGLVPFHPMGLGEPCGSPCRHRACAHHSRRCSDYPFSLWCSLSKLPSHLPQLPQLTVGLKVFHLLLVLEVSTQGLRSFHRPWLSVPDTQLRKQRLAFFASTQSWWISQCGNAELASQPML